MGGREPVTLPKMSFYYQTSTEAILMCLHNYNTHTEAEFSPLCYYVFMSCDLIPPMPFLL